MKCPFCHSADTRVVDSRPADDGSTLRRRRHCDVCSERFTTYERVWQNVITVVKKDGRREEFSRDKLLSGITKACNKRSVTTEQIIRLVEAVEAELRRDGLLEVPAERVGEMVMDRLLQLDEVAYVRFASVYQQFDDVKRFAQILDRMSRRSRRRTTKNIDAKAVASESADEGKANRPSSKE